MSELAPELSPEFCPWGFAPTPLVLTSLSVFSNLLPPVL